MATLKSALRFPPAHPPPPHPAGEDPPMLKSRFSAETLVIKKPLRLFSSGSSTSPPSSPFMNPTKRYRRRVSSQKGSVCRHAPSASESRIAVSSPKAYDLPDLPIRTSLDETLPRRPSSLSRTRTTSSNAADKFTGAAKEVMQKFSSMRRGHRRDDSHSSASSGGSAESLASPRPRSISSPSPAPPPVALHAAPQPPSRASPSRPKQPPFRLVDLPPRLDSRNALAVPARAGRLPALAATRPRPKQQPPPVGHRPRPATPPSPSVPPLRSTRPPPCAPSPTPETHARLSFQARALKLPSLAAVHSVPRDELFVRIDVGGESTYTTSVGTFLDRGCSAGHLGDFVESAFEDVRRSGTVDKGKPLLQLPSTYSHDSASSAELSLLPSCAPSPYPASPFLFADDLSSCDGALPLDLDDPLSPIDPLISAATAALAAKDLARAFAPTFSTPPDPLVRVTPQQVFVVAPPTASQGRKHCSVYPDVAVVCGSDQVSLPAGLTSPVSVGTPTLPVVSLAQEAARRALAMRVARRSSTADSSNEGEDNEIRFVGPFVGEPFFDVVRHQSHAPITLSSTAGDDLLSPPGWPIDSSPSPSSPITAFSARSAQPFVANERYSLDFGALPIPAEVDGYGSEEEYRSRSTVLGVPRCFSRRSLEGLHGASSETAAAAVRTVDERENRDREDSALSVRTPSMSKSVTTATDDDESHVDQTRPRPSSLTATPAVITQEDATLVVFLDRCDAPLLSLSQGSRAQSPTACVSPGQSIYSAIFSFLRTGSLPPSLVLPRDASRPRSSSAPDVDVVFLSLFRLSSAPLFGLLVALQTVGAEAAWLGLRDLEAACEQETRRVGEVVEWLTQTNEGKKEVREKVKQQSREKEGWI
ncbi:uncharacterized protein JCM10292_007680 [Rhodotorula paludigena]|uniref:uncharacterized protein n=1 Tax=Rhodotorula paludigena TaxID=86838 RepID=UPI00317A3B73